ncbi:MAG: hypothetical protein IJ705_08505 [Oscillospiraceae bacterium]|nr:hypothetical protein [Oscillospiraceae bacterium]
MENQLWALFRETGEPMGYLLYRGETRALPERTEQKPGPTQKDGTVPSF